MTGPAFKDVFPAFERDAPLDPVVVRNVFDTILAGAWTPVQIAGFAVALRLRGETPEVIGAAAQSLRAAMVELPHSHSAVLDTCGTGGDGAGSVNVSTGAAVIAAAAGVRVAKHGNRAVSSRAGSADVLEALGIQLDVPIEQATDQLDTLGITFMMAPNHHPAMRHGGVARRELGIRTIFNCLGPLANPARATHQLLGAYSDRLRPILAAALRDLGVRRAWVVRGADGLDEVSPCGPTHVTELAGGALKESIVTPADFGLAPITPDALRGGDADQNAHILETILHGQAHPARNAFVLNAAAALVVAKGLAPKAAARRAAEVLDSGAAGDLLKRWRTHRCE